MKRIDEIEGLISQRIEINIVEPDQYVFEGTNRRQGRVRRILKFANKVGDEVPFAVVELDNTLPWEESTFRVISIIARFREPLAYLLSGKEILVNINGRQEWILDCAADDPRIGNGVGSRWLGFGAARLVDLARAQE